MISLNTFVEMKKLRHLDLSYNWLEGVDYRILENNKELTTLDLSGNKFMTLANRPIIQSKSLESLLLKDTKLSNMHQLLFSELPKLRYLDLSQNLLITVESMSAFSKLKHLEEINLQDNNWKCDKNWKALTKWFRDKDILLKKNQCCE